LNPALHGNWLELPLFCLGESHRHSRQQFRFDNRQGMVSAPAAIGIEVMQMNETTTAEVKGKNMKANCERLAGDMRVVITDAEELLRSTAGELTDKAREARGHLKTALSEAKGTCDALREKARSGARAADRTVRDHPYQALGIALATGLVAGVVLARA
jgi:ElaB/YqjD/DUF883 family membrane-anchored ribosome-binding protein